MKLVKRCNDNVISILIILHALHIRLALQKIIFAIISTLAQKEHRKYGKLYNGPSTPKGELTSFAAADKKS